MGLLSKLMPFGGGGGGSFSGGGAFNKSSATSTTADTKNTGFNFSEVAGSAAASNLTGDHNTVNMLDGGAINGAMWLGGKSVDNAAWLGGKVADTSASVAKSSMDNSAWLGGKVADNSAWLANNAFGASLKFATEHDARQMDVLDQLVKTGGSMFEAAASQTDQAASQQKMILYVAGAFVLVYAIQAFSK